jgi:hypothetical protein
MGMATENIPWSIIFASVSEERSEGEMDTSAEERKFWLVLAGFAATGLLLLIGAYFFPDHWKLRRLLLEAIGEAFIVAAILGLTVDKYLKGDLLQRASKDVHKYLVGYNLPDEIKQRIQELMGTALVRRDWQIHFSLTPTDTNEVLIDVSYSFQLENVSNRVQDYLPMVQIEKHMNPRILELRCDDPDSKFRLAPSEGQQSIGEESETVPGLVEVRADTLKVKPAGKDRLTYPMSGHFQLRTPHEHSDTFSFGHPSIGVTITTSCPETHKFSLEPEPAMIVTENMYQMRHRAFLRSEHMRIRWMRVEHQHNSSAIVHT